ncbi:hypothetical protein EDM53_02260 [Rickettsiales endosymbiont of Peranema trichophorum]|uniref:hypothetical protein n=1 Tax=Rickettsiales endosymbiont of Peranema trichophorum TaxID=2486577 RepID=UPI001023531C|nr:hypothetical protein [Rickettsiales endosymbiont of Peranema trichophorum]RZI47370.1 hypothetical protein EDM53_02260 [Rickettsiales endosymbiont of Peranema trichophorum]
MLNTWLLLFDYREIKFESYATFKEFERVMKEMFHVGDDVEESMKKLTKSGAECSIVSGEESEYSFKHKGVGYVAVCTYDTYSLQHFGIHYYVIFEAHHNKRMLYITSGIRIAAPFVT